MNAITTTAPPLAFGDLERLADAIAKSQLFGIKTKDQALVLMMIAHAEGRHPALAARDYDIVQGRPAKKAEAMMRDFLQAGGKVEWHSLTDELADATFTHPQTGSVRIDWDMKRALTAFGKKDMYTKFPRQMLRSRVVSEGVRTLWPLATSGMYVPEEAADIKPEHNGPTIEAEAPTSDVANTPKPETTPPPSRREQINEAVPRGLSHLEEKNPAQWLKNLDVLLANAETQEEVVEIGGHHSVGTAVEKAPAAVRTRISEMLATAFAKFAETAAETEHDRADEPVPEVEIAGEERLAAG